MGFRSMLTILAAVCFTGAACLPARADLTGSQVSVIGAYASAGPVTVGPGIEFPLGSLSGYVEQIDLTGDQIIITTPDATSYYPSASFDGFTFNFTGAPTITSVSVDSASTLDPVGFTFTSDQVAVNLEGLSVTPGTTTILDVSTAATPEPSSFALMGTGLLGLAGVVRRRWRMC